MAFPTPSMAWCQHLIGSWVQKPFSMSHRGTDSWCSLHSRAPHRLSWGYAALESSTSWLCFFFPYLASLTPLQVESITCARTLMSGSASRTNDLRRTASRKEQWMSSQQEHAMPDAVHPFTEPTWALSVCKHPYLPVQTDTNLSSPCRKIICICFWMLLAGVCPSWIS